MNHGDLRGSKGRNSCPWKSPAGYVLVLLLPAMLARCQAEAVVPTDQLLSTAEEKWETDAVASYVIVVDVDRPGERRRNTIRIHEGEITRATTSYWDVQKKRWGALLDLKENQAYPFTVAGLFETARSELLDGVRAEIRVTTTESPPFIRRIFLGPHLQQGRSRLATEATILVIQFQELHVSGSKKNLSLTRWIQDLGPRRLVG